MRVLIIGAGEVGQHLARVLSREGHKIVVIDHDREVLERLEDSLDVQVIAGHGSSASLLERAGAWGADVVLAVTNHDEVNMLAAHFAKVQGAKRTIVRFTDREELRYHRHFYKKTLGLDAILVPLDLCAQEIGELIRARQAVAIENFAGGQVQMRQVPVSAGSAWTGKTLLKIKMPRQTLVAAILRGGEFMVPSGDTEIMPEDELLIIGHVEAMAELGKVAETKRTDARLVVIVGGGDLGLSVARSLEYSDIKVRLIESDRARAEEVSGELDNVLVVHGDGTDTSLLKEAGADHSDVFIALSGEDEKNLMMCQLAKKLGARKTIALVNKPSYISIYEELGVDAAISPRLLVAQEILRYVRSGAVTRIAVIEEGRAEVIEIQAREGSKIIRGPLMKLGFPRGAIIGSVAREGKVFIPTGDFQVQAGDSCIIFSFTENIPLIERFFQGKNHKQAEERNERQEGGGG